MNPSQMTDLDLIYSKVTWQIRQEEALKRAETVSKYIRKLLSLGIEYYYRVPRYQNIKPEQIKHLTDHELLIINIDETNFNAWKKEFEARNRMPSASFKNFYLTRKEFNHDNLPIHTSTSSHKNSFT